MFRFVHPDILYLLALLPLLAVVFFIVQRRNRKRLARYGDLDLIRTQIEGYSPWRPMAKLLLLLLALASLIIAVARPQYGQVAQTQESTGVEVMVALDVSNSMLAEDIQPNRLERAKSLLDNLFEQLRGHKMGLVVFAGDAFVQVPLTTDFRSAQTLLEVVDTKTIGNQGTSLAAALRAAQTGLSKRTDTGKAIVLVTDAEDHEGEAERIAKALNSEGINIYVLGVGGTEGVPIPYKAEATNFPNDESLLEVFRFDNSQPQTDGNGYLTDNEGNTVLTKFNVDVAKQLAAAGKGQYIQVDNSLNANDAIITALDKLKQSNTELLVYDESAEQYQVFIALALVFLLLDICLLERSNPRFAHFHLFSKKS